MMRAVGGVRSISIVVCCALPLALGFAAGCGSTVRELVRDGVDEANKPVNLKRLTNAVHDLASALTSGLSDGVPTGKLTSQFAPLVENLVRTTLHAAAEGLDTDLSPAVARAVRTSVDAALAPLLADSTRHGIEELENTLIAAAVQGLTRGLRDQIGPAIADTLDKSLGPALRRTIQDHLGPAIAEALAHDLKPALVDAARQTATAVGEGLVDGARSRAEPALDQLLVKLHTELGAAKQDVYSVFEIVLFLVLALAVGVLLVIAWLRHRTAAGATDALQLVTSQIGQMRDESLVQELAGRIKHAGDGTRAGTYLSAHLQAHPASKIPVADLPVAASGGRAR